MKATGIVRRIDDLGRIVVPKEIRRTLRIREGDPLEIFTDREGEIILKKYSPIGELSQFAGEYAESLAQTTGHLVLITDCDHVVTASGAGKKEYEQEIRRHLEAKGVQLIILAGYMRFIGEELLTHYPRRIINIHPAYLPAFPGAHGIRDAYEAKVPETGVTVHYVDEGIDTGDIIAQRKLAIDPAWSLETLETHVHALEYELFPQVVKQLCEEIEEGKS